MMFVTNLATERAEKQLIDVACEGNCFHEVGYGLW